MYLVFNERLSGYSSFTNSMETAFCVMLGKFDAIQYVLANSILGPLIFSAYNIVILYFTLNIFIAIIVESFNKTRLDSIKNPEKFGFTDYIITKLKNKLRKKDTLPSSEEYKSHLDVFSTRVDELIAYFIKVSHFWSS